MQKSNSSSASRDLKLPAPRDLEVRFIRRGGEDLAVLSFSTEPAELVANVTPAERAVIEGLIRGHSNARIARDRDRAPRTIANQIASVFKKLGVKSRSELIARYAQHEE